MTIAIEYKLFFTYLQTEIARLTSGVYMYQINAAGVDGTVFTSTKKMILNK